MDIDTTQGSEQFPPRRKNYKVLGTVVLLCVVGLLGWLAYYNLHAHSSPDEALQEQFVWRFTDAQPLPGQARRTDVTLSVAGTDLPAGTYEGICTLIDGEQTKFLSGELSVVICLVWDAGGNEIVIFKENDSIALKRSDFVAPATRGAAFAPVTKANE